MSMENLEKALELAEQCLYYEFCGEKTDETIGKAEYLLGFNLSEQMKLYLTQYGYISFFGNEFYGILKDDFSGGYTGNCVESALIDRKELNLPLKWLPIHELGDGYMAYQNYDVINEDNEPPIIMAIFNGTEFIVEDTIADDFGDFFLEQVLDCLENQNALG